MNEDKSPAGQAAYIIRDIKDSTKELDKRGRRYETLGDDIMDVLQQIAAGKKVTARQQQIALRAGERIRHKLSWAALAALCNFPSANAG